MDAQRAAAHTPGPTGRWRVWAGWICVIGIAVCAVFSSIEIDTDLTKSLWTGHVR